MSLVDKNRWLASCVAGRNFADVGGLWGTVNEMVSVASQAGAAYATMIDIQPAGNWLWKAFDERMASLGVKNYACIEADAMRDGFEGRVGVYDVVHCSGILYHLADPLTLLLALRKITREQLILTSMYVPETIDNAAGRLDLRGGASYLIHALSGEQGAVIRRHFEDLELKVGGLTVPLNEPLALPDGTFNTSPWWWLMTPALLRSMLTIAGFHVLDEGDSWEGRSRSFLCAPAHG